MDKIARNFFLFQFCERNAYSVTSIERIHVVKPEWHTKVPTPEHLNFEPKNIHNFQACFQARFSSHTWGLEVGKCVPGHGVAYGAGAAQHAGH